MKITRSRKYHVSMGNYEWIEFGADVTLDSDDIAYGPKATPEGIAEEAERILSEALLEDIKDAHIDTDEADSFIHRHPSIPQTRRTRR